MGVDKLLLKDSSGEKSLTATAFIIGFIVVNLKLILAGVKIGAITFSVFSGSEYGLAVASLGAVYVLRRNSRDKNGDGKVDEKDEA